MTGLGQEITVLRRATDGELAPAADVATWVLCGPVTVRSGVYVERILAHKFGTVVNVDLLVDPPTVGDRGVLTDAQLLSDLVVEAPVAISMQI